MYWFHTTLRSFVVFAGCAVALGADPDRSAEFTITTRLVATNTPPIGVNEFGDPGGTDYSAGNLIPGYGFEPVSIRRFWRATAAGSNWVELDLGGMTDWDLTQGGYLSAADFRIYRIVDTAGQSIVQSNAYLDLTRADH